MIPFIIKLKFNSRLRCEFKKIFNNRLDKFYLFLLFTFLNCVHVIGAEHKDLWELYTSKNYNEAINGAVSKLKNSPYDAELHLIIGRSYTELLKFDQALPYLKASAANNNKNSWINAWSYVYLGRCYFFLGDYIKAEAHYKDAIWLRATKNSVKIAKRDLKNSSLNTVYSKWHEVETQHMKFYFQDTNGIENINKYVQAREEALLQNNTFFKANLPKKIDYYIWENRNDAKKEFGRELGWANSNMVSINSAKNQTLGHELTHILAHFGIPPKQRSPFINEGLAVYFNHAKTNKLNDARKVLKGKTIDIVDLWANPKKENFDLNYPVGGAFIEYLFIHATNDQIKQLIENQTVEAAKIIFPNFNELIIGFEKQLVN